MARDYSNVKGYIYKCVSPNGKIYIGQTINYYKRKSQYKYGHFSNQKKLWNNCNKYGWNPADTFQIIEECYCGLEKEFINEREKYWVKYYDSFNNGLNCNEGGGGYIVSDEVRKQRSLQKKGKKLSEKHRKKISEGLLNSDRVWVVSDEQKKKMSEAKTKLKKEEHSQYGKPRSEETKEKIRQSLLGRKQSEETKEKRRLTKERKKYEKISNDSENKKNI